MFDEHGLCEVSSPEFPGERLVVCRNPAVAAERARKREALLDATETELQKIQQMTQNRRSNLHGASAATIAQRAGRVINKNKMGKHFIITTADGSFSFKRDEANIEQEALFDGIYILRTGQPARQLSASAVVRAYKNLKVNERSFKQMKSTLELRPVHHRLADRVRAHVFLCMLARYVQFELESRLAPMLFTDETPCEPVDPTAPARRSPHGQHKASTRQTADGFTAHSLNDLLSDLATICKNTLRIGDTQHTFERTTTPTPLQDHALKLAGVTLK